MSLYLLQSENLTETIYYSNWLYASPEVKKIMLMLIARTQKPFKLTANGYLTMNMNTLGSVSLLEKISHHKQNLQLFIFLTTI